MSPSIKRALLFIIYLCCAAILAVPLLVSKSTLFPYIFGKIIFFRIFVEIAFASWITLAIFDKGYRPQWRHPLTLSFTLFIGILVLTMITGVDPWNSFWSTQERMTGVLTFLHFWAWYLVAAHTIKGWSQWRALFLFSISVSVLSILYGIFDHKPLFITTLGNPIYVGSYATLNAFFATFIFWKERNRLLRAFLAVSIIGNIGAMLGAGSRSVFYSFVLALGAYALFFIFRVVGRRLRIWFAVGIGAFALFAIGLFFFMQIPSIKEWGIVHLPYTINRVLYSQSANEDRIVLWNAGLKGFLDRPFLGWGWENYNAIYEKHLVPRPYMEPWYDRSHNQLIDVLALTGIVGLLAYLLFWGSLFFLLWKKSRDITSVGEIAALGVLGSGFVFYFLQNLTIFDNPAPLIAFFFFLAFAAKATAHPSRSDTDTEPQKLLGRNAWGIAVIVFVAIGYAAYAWNIVPFMKSKEGIDGFFALQGGNKNGLNSIRSSLESNTFTNSEILSQVVALFLDTMDDPRLRLTDQEAQYWLSFYRGKLQDEATIHPYNLKNRLALAGVDVRYTQFDASYIDKAETIVREIISTSPLRREGYTQLSDIKRIRKDYPAALEYAKKALELGADRDLPYMHWLLAISYLDVGDIEQAIYEMDEAERIGYPIYSGSGLAVKLAQHLSPSKKNDRIISYIEAGVFKDPNNFYFLAGRVIAYFRIGERDRAEKLLRDLERRDKSVSDQIQLFLNESDGEKAKKEN